MIVIVAVVGALALHILLNILEISLAGNKFPVKHFQLSSGSLYPVAAPIDFDLSGFC